MARNQINTKYKYVVICFFILFSIDVFTQNEYSSADSNFQFGIGTKINIELNHKFSPAFKASLTGGVGYDATIDNGAIFPAVHAGVLFFNKGSIGADQSKNAYRIQYHFYTNAQVTGQLDKRDFDYKTRSVPLYHFAEFNANPLQNPYKSSLTYGANMIFLQDKKFQRIGFFNLNIVGRAQVSYYNDGGPVLKWVGDKRDRYYTGGVVISYHGDTVDPVNLIELSYHKYTGYQKFAFDVADKLQIDYLNYNDNSQFSYNQQRWRLNVSSTKNGFGGSVSIYNVNILDLQDFLHFNTNVPYHPNYYRGYRWMIGGRHAYNQIIVPQ